jgi:hypothetical protein
MATLSLENYFKSPNAIEFIRSKFTPASLNQIKDDPGLAALWKDPAFQNAIEQNAKPPVR